MRPGAVTWLGLVIDAALSGGKVATGLLFSSQAILADGLHSASDLVTDVAVLAGIRVSARPADPEHPYGHRRVSTLVAMFVGLMLLGAAGYIVFSAIESLRGPVSAVAPLWPLAMAAVSVPAKEILYRLTRRTGKAYDDASLVANAWHHRTDAFSSLAATAGLAGVLIGGAEWQFLDAATATILSAFLAVVAVRILRKAAGELIDRAPGDLARRQIARAVLATPGVRSYHALRARKLSGKITADIHIQVDPELTVHQGHEIATAARRSVRRADPDVIDVIVHIEPYEPDNPNHIHASDIYDGQQD
jgi:cation diffusion facilitator family transporter